MPRRLSEVHHDPLLAASKPLVDLVVRSPRADWAQLTWLIRYAWLIVYRKPAWVSYSSPPIIDNPDLARSAA